ncbi:MAG: glycosyltransferase family 4 protein [Steroidobacteraceae bacterium]
MTKPTNGSLSKPRWLFVDAAPDFGGHEVMLLRWLQELNQQQRITPVLLARLGTRLYQQAAAQSGQHLYVAELPAIRAVTSWRRVRTSLDKLGDVLALMKALLRVRPTLAVVAEGCLLSQAWVTVLLRLLGIKTVVYVPLVEPGVAMGFGRGLLRDRIMRIFYRHVPHAWITLTTGQAQQLRAWSGITTPVFTLPNTVATHIENTSMAIAPPHRPLRVLVLGRLDAHQKGLNGLLDFLCEQLRIAGSIAGHRAPDPDSLALLDRMHITLVGDGPYGAEIKQRLHDYSPLRQLLSLRAWAPTVEVMREHDVLLLVSRYEGVPLVMLEAMALGLPIAASDLPGTRSLLPAEALFPVGDYPRALQRLFQVTHPTRMVELVQRNRQSFNLHASAAAFAGNVSNLTDELLQLSTGVPPATESHRLATQLSGSSKDL